MKIEFGKAYINKTWKFLVPVLRGYGDIFISKFNEQLFKLAYGINDKALEGAAIIQDKRPIFILCDKAVIPHKFNQFMDWIRYQPYYVTDYQTDTNINSRTHMLVLDIPEEYHRAYDKFCVGLYSEMFTEEQLNFLFKDKNSEQYKILSRDYKYGESFIEKIKKQFSVSFNVKEKRDFLNVAEYELPYYLEDSEEVF